MKGQPRFDTHEGVVAPRRGPHKINNRISAISARARSYRARVCPPEPFATTRRSDSSVAHTHATRTPKTNAGQVSYNKSGRNLRCYLLLQHVEREGERDTGRSKK